MLIHGFHIQLLNNLHTEDRVRASLWAVFVDEILPIYKRTREHVAFILRTEREGNLITTNHYFSENLEKARAARSKEERVLQTSTISMALRLQPNATTDLMERIPRISNPKHTVQDIHDILKAYYTVAQKRCVDNICMQATDYHLVSGPETPLKVFSPTFVGTLTSNQLELIAGEDSASIQRRKELYKQIEGLRDGEKNLRIMIVQTFEVSNCRSLYVQLVLLSL